MVVLAIASSPAGANAAACDGIGGLNLPDFNGDGCRDLAIGVPGEDFASNIRGVGRVTDAGAVEVLYGAAGGGFSASKAQVWTQSSKDVEGTPADGDQFGYALVARDFDVDGRSDLAIGIPSKDLKDPLGHRLKDAGAVEVLYGSPGGLTGAHSQQFTQSSLRFSQSPGDLRPSRSDAGDQFGHTLVARIVSGGNGPFLAVGAPFEDRGVFRSPVDENTPSKDAGEVDIIYSRADRLKGANSQRVLNASHEQCYGGHFGYAMNVANEPGGNDIRGQEYAIGVGAPANDGSGPNSGMFEVLEYDPSESEYACSQYRTPKSQEFGQVSGGEQFGFAITHLRSTFFVGAPGGRATSGQPIDSGYVVRVTPHEGVYDVGFPISQDTGQLEDSAEVGDRFGSALTIWSDDPHVDGSLVVGVPREDVLTDTGMRINAGAIELITGIGTSPSEATGTLMTQDSNGVPDFVEAGDRWGSVLYSRIPFVEGKLPVGDPFEDVLRHGGSSESEAGAVQVLGSGAEIQDLTQENSLGPNHSEHLDHFGWALG
jgi:hypothetical protein